MNPALIGASVALFTFALTQWIFHRREQAKLLLTKLEELYLLLLEFGERNGKRGEYLHKVSRREVELSIVCVDPFSPSEWLGIDLGQKLDLYISFYFPSLHGDLERLYAANRVMNGVYSRLNSGQLTYQEIQLARSTFGDAVGTLLQQILAERLLLTKNIAGDIAAFYDRFCYGTHTQG